MPHIDIDQIAKKCTTFKPVQMQMCCCRTGNKSNNLGGEMGHPRGKVGQQGGRSGTIILTLLVRQNLRGEMGHLGRSGTLKIQAGEKWDSLSHFSPWASFSQNSRFLNLSQQIHANTVGCGSCTYTTTAVHLSFLLKL